MSLPNVDRMGHTTDCQGAVEALAQIHDKAKYLAEGAWNAEGTRLVGEHIMRLASSHAGVSGTSEPDPRGVRFEVRRTSLYGDERPCPEAILGSTQVWDVRTYKSPEEHDAKHGHREKWHERGTEHGLVYGPRGGVRGIKRRLADRPAWFVEIASLDALLAFYRRHGELVIGESWSNNGQPAIEIYDGYRE